MTNKVTNTPNISIPFNVQSVPAIGAYLTNLVQSLGSVLLSQATAINGTIDDVNSIGKVITGSYDIATVGPLSFTGVGFTPSSVILLLGETGTSNKYGSIGFGDAVTMGALAISVNTTTFVSIVLNTLGIIQAGASTVVLTSLDSDGFTLTVSKSGTPTGTASFIALCLR